MNTSSRASGLDQGTLPRRHRASLDTSLPAAPLGCQARAVARPLAPPLALSLTLSALAVTATGCGGTEREDKAWSAQLQKNEGPVRETEALGALPPDANKVQQVAVRHDLELSPKAEKVVSCSCLRVAVGLANDSRFSWVNERPATSADMLAIAISDRGVECPSRPDEGARRASISGVELSNGDVLVEVEDLPPGRPLARGALIPRPASSGGVYIRSRTSKTPYGAAGGRRGGCRVQ
jgi:hypothetical protein